MPCSTARSINSSPPTYFAKQGSASRRHAAPPNRAPGGAETTMSEEHWLIAERRKKVAELRAAGINPYANGFKVTHTSAELKQLAPDIPPVAERSEAPGRAGQFREA